MSESKIARTETNSPPGKNNGDIGTMHSNILAYFSHNNELTLSWHIMIVVLNFMFYFRHPPGDSLHIIEHSLLTTDSPSSTQPQAF